MRRDLQKHHSPKLAAREQSLAFAEAARSLECDESEERFDAALKKIAAKRPADATKPMGRKSGAK
jgi:hypothetical protein